MMSKQMQTVYEVARQIDANLTAYDFHGDRVVTISHEDGTRLVFHCAFLQVYFHPDHQDRCEHPGEWILVFTEHHGFHVYHRDDLSSYSEYKRVRRDQKHKDHPGDRYICEACEETFVEPNREDGKLVCPNDWCSGVVEGQLIDYPNVRLMTKEELVAHRKEEKESLKEYLLGEIAALQEQLGELED